MVTLNIASLSDWPPPVGLVPAAVSHLRVENNGSQNSLKVLWDKASGDVDSYIVSLTSPGSTPIKKKLSSETTNVMFDSLSPGKSYQVLVNTTSGHLSNQNWSTGKTGKGRLFTLHLRLVLHFTLYTSFVF